MQRSPSVLVRTAIYGTLMQELPGKDWASLVVVSERLRNIAAGEDAATRVATFVSSRRDVHRSHS